MTRVTPGTWRPGCIRRYVGLVVHLGYPLTWSLARSITPALMPEPKGTLMDSHELRRQLEHLQTGLRQIPPADAAARAQLEQVLDEIQAMLDQPTNLPPHSPSLGDRLRGAAGKFEVLHPHLTRHLARLSWMLNQRLKSQLVMGTWQSNYGRVQRATGTASSASRRCLTKSWYQARTVPGN